jgi:hypothetical protein
MKTKTFAGLIVLVLSLVALTGWSCGQGYGVSNWEDTAPTAKTYQNDEWGVRFQYPNGWQYREYRETIEGEEIVTLAFSDQELPETLPPEPLFPIMISRDARNVDEIVAIHADAISIEDKNMGGMMVKAITRYSDILEQNYPIYVVSLPGGSMQVLSLDARYTAIAESMISTLVETE